MNARKPDQPVKFWRKRAVVLGAVAALVLVIGMGLLAWLARPLLVGPKLTVLTLSGHLVHVDPAAVRRAVIPELGSGFFTTRVDRIGEAVAALPWVASVSVRREWPHTVHIDLVEEVPVARWNGDGLMDAQGQVFVHNADKAYASLPMLSGRDDSAQDVLAQYDTLAALLQPRGIAIVALSVDARGAATVELDDGIEVRLGREDAEQRLARFSAVALPALAAKLTTVAYVDMRYTNGFAVGWKTAGARTKQGA
ncbi:MAG TPA: cell division protein FtsQ/DivIB [Gammaproteobacteria bacterium]|nr:cell division protein FtsQ/DivIB [Gammaproteobacteria bacterium]